MRTPRVQSVANFVALCTGGAGGSGYLRTVVASVRPGEFVRAGAPGSARLGEVEAPELAPNPELASAAAFRLTHRAPGTVSLALSADDDDDAPPRAPFTGFRITTGPGPVPSLDGANVVIGRVTAGLDVVAAVARTPTFAPLPSARSWNSLAAALGDGRAAKARAGRMRGCGRSASALTRCQQRRRAARGASRGRRSSPRAACCSREARPGIRRVCLTE